MIIVTTVSAGDIVIGVMLAAVIVVLAIIVIKS